jgi:hypothetical protein
VFVRSLPHCPPSCKKLRLVFGMKIAFDLRKDGKLWFGSSPLGSSSFRQIVSLMVWTPSSGHVRQCGVIFGCS